MEVCTHEKAVFFLPVNTLTVWSPAFLATRHTTVRLDMPIYALTRAWEYNPIVAICSSSLQNNHTGQVCEKYARNIKVLRAYENINSLDLY